MERIRFHWRYNVRPDEYSTVLDVGQGLTSETVIKEEIAKSLGDRTLAQYINILRMERERT